MRIALIKATLILGISAVAGGCTTMTLVTQRMANLQEGLFIRAQNHQELARLRLETNEQLANERQEARRIAAQREQQQARIDLERQRLEMEFCHANQQAQQQLLQQQIRENVMSKVAFNVVHGLDIGELEVDTEQLELLLEQRKLEPPPIQQQQQPSCKCYECECGCAPGLLKKHCRHCRYRPCHRQKDCGGPLALEQALQQQQRPLRPAEIPLKLPVRLSFGMQQPQLEETRIQREPRYQQQQQKPCDYPQKCDDYPYGNCPIQAGPPPVPSDFD